MVWGGSASQWGRREAEMALDAVRGGGREVVWSVFAQTSIAAPVEACPLQVLLRRRATLISPLRGQLVFQLATQK